MTRKGGRESSLPNYLPIGWHEISSEMFTSLIQVNVKLPYNYVGEEGTFHGRWNQKGKVLTVWEETCCESSVCKTGNRIYFIRIILYLLLTVKGKVLRLVRRDGSSGAHEVKDDEKTEGGDVKGEHGRRDWGGVKERGRENTGLCEYTEPGKRER